MCHCFRQIPLSYMMPFESYRKELDCIANAKLHSVLQRAASTMLIPYSANTLQQCPKFDHLSHHPFSQAQWPQFQGPPEFKQAIFLPISCQPTTNSLQSVDSALWSLSMATRLRATSPPSRAMEGWPPPDRSSQHTVLSCSAFSPAAVSWTTSGDKRLPECLACRQFTRTQRWFILALHKQASV